MDSTRGFPRKTRSRPYLTYQKVRKKFLCPICQVKCESDQDRQHHLDTTHPGWAADYVRKVIGKGAGKDQREHSSNNTGPT